MYRALLALLLLAACGGSGDEPAGQAGTRAASPPDTAMATEAAQGQPERGVFTILKGGQPILTERFTRTPERLETELTAPGEERVVQTAALKPDGTIERVEIQEDAAADGSAPAARLSIVLQGDTAAVEARQGDETETGRVGGVRDAIPLPVAESPAMLEQILRRARALGGEQVQVPILSQDGETSAVSVQFTGADGARVRAGDTEWTVTTDDAGRLLAASSAAQDLTIRRDPGTP